MISLWRAAFVFSVLISADSVKSLDICDKICYNVNLSKSVVTLKSEVKNGTTHVLLNNGTKTLETIVCTRKETMTKFSLESGGNEFIYEYTPIRDGNSYYYSIAVHSKKLQVFLDGFPAAAWTLDSLTGITPEERLKISDDINLDFTAILNDVSSSSVYKSDRCSAEFQMFSDLPKCTECMSATKEDAECVDLDKALPICGSECSVKGFCPASQVEITYGVYNWKPSLVSDDVIEAPCQYDDDSELTVKRICIENDAWSTVETTECVKTSATAKLQNILSSDSKKSREFLEVLEDSVDLSNSDLLLSYDIINEISNRGEGGVEHGTGINLVKSLTQITHKSVCQRNPACYWIVELMRGVVERLSNETVLMMSENVGMFYMTEVNDILEINTFCQHTFHDMISGCSNDDNNFLQVMQNEFVRLMAGTKTNSMRLSLIFSDDFTFYQAANTITPHQFKSLILEEGNPAGAETVATFIVDVGAQGLPANTETNLYFALHPDAVYSARERMFVYGDSTYEIKYECGYFQTNHSRDSYLKAQGKSWDPASSYISAENFVDLDSIVKKGGLLGEWTSETCNTDYDKFSNSPSIICTCTDASQAFTVLARVLEKEFPDNYVEIMVSLAGISIFGIFIGLTMILLPAKIMGIPKAVKINIVVIMLLLVVALYFLLSKMAFEFRNFKF